MFKMVSMKIIKIWAPPLPPHPLSPQKKSLTGTMNRILYHILEKFFYQPFFFIDS